MTVTYKEAIKALRKIGASHAEGDALSAMASNLLADRFAMNASLIYSWGQKHGINLWLLARKLRNPLSDNEWEFISAVMEDVAFTLKPPAIVDWFDQLGLIAKAQQNILMEDQGNDSHN